MRRWLLAAGATEAFVLIKPRFVLKIWIAIEMHWFLLRLWKSSLTTLRLRYIVFQSGLIRMKFISSQTTVLCIILMHITVIVISDIQSEGVALCSLATSIPNLQTIYSWIGTGSNCPGNSYSANSNALPIWYVLSSQELR